MKCVHEMGKKFNSVVIGREEIDISEEYIPLTNLWKDDLVYIPLTMHAY